MLSNCCLLCSLDQNLQRQEKEVQHIYTIADMHTVLEHHNSTITTCRSRIIPGSHDEMNKGEQLINKGDNKARAEAYCMHTKKKE